MICDKEIRDDLLGGKVMVPTGGLASNSLRENTIMVLSLILRTHPVRLAEPATGTQNQTRRVCSIAAVCGSVLAR